MTGKRLEEKVGFSGNLRKMGLATFVSIAALGGYGFECEDKCAQLNRTADSNYFISQTYNANNGDYECPEGCTPIGETEDQYCCECKEE